MNSRVGWSIITVLGVIVVVLAVALFLIPAPVSAPAFTSDNVNVSLPLPNAAVSKIFTVVGEARGTWFFEASFPVQVRDPANNLIGQGIAMTASNWMTTEFVPFTASVTVDAYSGPATLVLLKDNPSGLPENADSAEFPIVVQ